MQTYSYELKKAIEKYGFIPKELPKNAKYEARATYWCGYWSKWFKVLEAKYKRYGKVEHLSSVTVQWEDGKIGTHQTSLDVFHDWKLLWPEPAAADTKGGS